jgi:hypothetical protein
VSDGGGSEVAGRTSQVAGERFSEAVLWLAGTALAVYAAARAVRFDTPIDRALPFVVVIMAAWAWCVRRTRWWPAVQLAIPIAIAFELMPLSEAARFAGISLSAAVAFAAALLAEPEIPFARGAFYVASVLILLRWIPWSDVPLLRELLVLAGALLVLFAVRRAPARAPAPHFVAPIGVAVAIVAALLTPAIPLRTVALPYVIAFLAWILRARRVQADLLGTALCAALIAMFPWSGIVARGLPFLLKQHRQERPREGIHAALAPSESLEIRLPPNAESLIVSGANVSRLPRGTTLGWIEPGHAALKIGDLADWGYMRRQHFFASRNHLPRHPAGSLHDYGYSAWVDGAARVRLPVSAGTIRVIANPHLPPSALLQIEAVEMGGR